MKYTSLTTLLTVLFGFFCAKPVLTQNKPQVLDSDVVKKSIKAVGYEVEGGPTKVVLVGTPAAPNASGEAKVEAKKSGTDIEVKVKGMPQPSTFGAEFLTYILWMLQAHKTQRV